MVLQSKFQERLKIITYCMERIGNLGKEKVRRREQAYGGGRGRMEVVEKK